MTERSGPSKTTRYAVIGTAFWFAAIFYRILQGNALSPRRAGYGIILLALAGFAAGLIEARRGVSLDWVTSFLLFCLCAIVVVVALVIALSVLL